MKISAPGVYNLDIETYHSDCCIGPSISSSGLRAVAECPLKYWAFSPYNPARLIEERTKALDFGSAAHALALGEPAFVAKFIVSPYDDFRKKEAQEWRDAQTKTIVKPADLETINAMCRSLQASPQCARAFEDGKPEQSLIWFDKETCIWLKARPDWLPFDPVSRLITEYKTCRTIEPVALSRDVFNYGYHVQAAMQIDAVEEAFCVNALGVAHVCQEKDAPYIAELRLFTAEHIALGRAQYRKALRIFAECMASGIWPGYTSEPGYFSTPYAASKQMEEFANV